MELSGAQILVEALKKEGVDVLFGYPGGAVINIFDALYDEEAINVILTRHEQGAAHAADGYARASGKVGVCIATSGPGATNLVTGIATAYMDSVPIVAITGQVPTSMIGNDAFQEADVTGITRPITKHNYLVKDVKDLARTIKEAFYIARTGRPGPVLIDIPKDVQLGKAEFNYDFPVNMRSYNPFFKPNLKQIKRAADLINSSKRPVIYSGGGIIISGAHKELTEFARKTGIPVATTLLGLGGFPETDPLSLGMLGMHGTVYANHAVQECDLLIAIGARFDDRVTGKLDDFAPHAKVIHIDIDPSAISKNVVVDIPIVGDAKEALTELIKHVKKLNISPWIEKIEGWKKEYPLDYDRNADTIKPQYVIEKIYELTKGDAIISTEVGQNQMWAAQFFKFTIPRQFLSSGGLGTMGYGFPAAIGAQIAKPDKLVFDIAGDGSIQMNIQELATAVANELPIKIIILNNSYLGMVRQWQELFFDKRYSSTCLERTKDCPPLCSGNVTTCPKYIPDFVKLAEAYNAVGIRIEKKGDVESGLKEAINSKRTVLVDIIIDREENVWPMVPPGAALNQMLGGMA